jgi:hypothetical protein
MMQVHQQSSPEAGDGKTPIAGTSSRRISKHEPVSPFVVASGFRDTPSRSADMIGRNMEAGSPIAKNARHHP